MTRYLSVPIAAVAVSALVLRGGFRRIEHVLLALSTVFAAYIAAGLLADPDWAAAAHGLLVPELPLTRDALLVAAATVGTTLAPWGLVFIQSYAVDKRLTAADFRYERIDVLVGAAMTGIIGFFIVVACAATLHERGSRSRRPPTRRLPSSPWPAALRRHSSAPGSSVQGSWPRRSCRSRPRTR